MPVQLWCDNDTVKANAPKLYTKMLKLLDRPEFPDVPGEAGSGWISVFRAELGQARVDPEPTSAAPGTSDHGQDGAVDFVIKKNGLIIAGVSKPKMQKDWSDTGYVDSRREATKGTDLVGPLIKDKKLWEAWHYRLVPPKKEERQLAFVNAHGAQRP